MLNTYIKNTGLTKTIIGNNCGNQMEEVKWDANYDGNKAKINLKTNLNGKKKGYHYTLNNADLAELFNTDTINIPIHKRLKNDFISSSFRSQPKIYRIELPDLNESQQSYSQDDPSSLMELLTSSDSDNNSYLSSPSTNEEFIIPIRLDQSTIPYERYTFTPKRRNLTLKTHRTHRVFKRPKSSSRRPKSSYRR
jgi:hypothetical protein